MLTLNEIKNISFRKSNFSGYKPEDVDDFIDQVVESYDLLIKKNIEQKETNEQLEEEIARLKSAVQNAPAAAVKPAPVKAEDIKLSEECEYTQEEIKNALLSAQKLANATIREARQKAEGLLSEANTKAERIVSAAQGEVNEQKAELDRLKKLVSDFRASLLDMYKEHLKLVNAMPTTQRIDTTAVKQPAAKPETPAPAEKPAESAPKQEEKPGPEAPAKAAEPAAGGAEAEEISQTKSFQLGKHKDETGEFSELKFGADYDIAKE